MAQEDQLKWDAKWSKKTGERAPSPAVLKVASYLPSEGTALDVAGGAGRHAIWLAKRGLQVTLVDISPVALSQARAASSDIRLVQADLDTKLGAPILPGGPWSLIVCAYYLNRELFGPMQAELEAGGTLLFIQPTVINLERHPRPSARFLLAPNEAKDLVPQLEIVHYEEGWSEDGLHQACLVAKKRRLAGPLE